MSKKKDRKSLPIEKRKELTSQMYDEYKERENDGTQTKYELRIELAKKYKFKNEKVVEQTIIRENNKRKDRVLES